MDANLIGFSADHGFGSDAMPVGENSPELASDKPSTEKIAEFAKRQFVSNPVFEKAGIGAIGRENMRVLPAAKRAGDLQVAKLAVLNEIAMLENPAHAKGTDADAQHAAISGADAGGALLHL